MVDDEMINRRFGKLTVIKLAPKNPNLKSRCKRYFCKCDCGNIVEVNGNSLRTGHTTSCGCSRKTSTNYEDLTGQRFGKLTALYIVGSSLDRRKIWKCQCDCGNLIEVKSSYLKQGSTKSCGCIKSFKEIQIKNYLTEKGIPFCKEYTFSNLKGVRNPLRFDFAVFDFNNQLIFLIEYQGMQHFDINNSWHTEQLIQSDIRKKEYCKNNNIPLYCLDESQNLIEELERICKIYGY